MGELVPLFQTLVWPVAIGLLLWWQKPHLGRVATALVSRIEQGASLKAGAVEIGAAPTLPSVPKTSDPRQVDALPHDIYLVHTARRDRGLDADGEVYYRLRIGIDADDPARLDEVTAVTYRLHPTFRDPVRRVTRSKPHFEIRTAAWGEFNMTAEIEFSNGDTLAVERYINLPATSDR